MVVIPSKLAIHARGIINSMSKTAAIPRVIFVLGAPGAGKGTQCLKISETYNFVHLSAGDLLRQERAEPTSKFGQMIDSYIRDGKIVPVEVTCRLIENSMSKAPSDKFLIDGFPRNQDNLDGWDRCMKKKVNLLCVLAFECPEDVCIERCLGRGAAGSGRTDDNVESLRKRFNTFHNETVPIIEHYDKLGLVRKIDGTRNADAVFEDVKLILEQVGI